MSKKTHLNKLVFENKGNLPLTEYYKSIPYSKKKLVKNQRTEFLIAVANCTLKSVYTARRWAFGYTRPSPMECQAIADLMNSKPEILFP